MEMGCEIVPTSRQIWTGFCLIVSPFREGGRKGNPSVRYVTNKELPTRHPPNVIGGRSHLLDFKDCYELKDKCTGLIDGITGELLSGSIHYILTGERYEGPIRNRPWYGHGAIVKNIYLPQNYMATRSMSALPKT